MASDILTIDSKTPGIGITVTELPGNARVKTVSLATQVMSLDRDLVIRVTTAEPHQPRCLVEHDPERGTYAGVVTLCPQIEFDDERRELIFLVDRSGSMGGYSDDSNISQAKKALQLFFRSLPEDCFINIVGFGSRHEFLWPQSVRYGQDTLATASRHIEGLRADLGGTEICAPLKAIFAQPTFGGYDRQVFVLTDGQVSNTSETVSVVRNALRSSPSTRVFALGLGSGASHELVDGIAEAGNGTAAYSLDKNSLQGTVIAQLKHAIQPALNQVTIEWKGAEGAPPAYDATDSEGAEASSGTSTHADAAGGGGLLAAFAGSSVGSLLGFSKKKKPVNPADAEGFARAPHIVPPVLSGERFLSYVLISKGGKPPSAVKVTAQSPAGNLDVCLPVTEADVVQGTLLHTMAARALIHDLQSGRSWLHADAGAGGAHSHADVKKEIIRLGTEYSLASKHTSFVAVQKKAERRQRDIAAERAAVAPRQQHFVSRSRRGAAPPVAACAMAAPSAPRNMARGGGGVDRMMMMKKSVNSMPKKEKASSRKMKSKKRDMAMEGAAAPPPPPPSAAAPVMMDCLFDAGNAATNSGGGGGAFGGMPPPPAPGGAPPAENADLFGFLDVVQKESAKEEEDASSNNSFAEEECGAAASFDDSDDDDEDNSVVDASANRLRKQAAAPTVSPAQSLQQLIALQAFSGSFELTSGFADVVGVPQAKIAELAAKSGVDDKAAATLMMATAVAIAFFRQKLADLEDQWELVVSKSLKWLTKQAKAHSASVDTFIDSAAALF
jgi:hypothetical protein